MVFSEAAFLFTTNIQSIIVFTLKGEWRLISSHEVIINGHSHYKHSHKTS